MSHNSRTNLDHFQFRDYSYNLGRWLSPDPAGMAAASLADPQSFNRYSYVENQPVNFADNSGLLLTLGEEQGWCDVDGTCNFTFGWANGASNFDMTPGSGCGSVSSLGQGACQLPPGLWPNGQPIMQSGVSIDFGGDLYGNLPGTNIPLSSMPLPWQINNNQECGDFAPCNGGTSWIYGFTRPSEIGTPKTTSQCSKYLDGSATGTALYTLCSEVFPNGQKSNQMRGCLEYFYNPGHGYTPIPVGVGPWFNWIDNVPGAGDHFLCLANTLGIL